MTIWSAGYKVRSIPELPEEKAVQIGSEFVGESFILVVSAATVLYEYNRSKEKEDRKAEQKLRDAQAERHELQLQLHALDVRLHALEQVVESNSQSVFAYLARGAGGKQYVPPAAYELVPITKPSTIALKSAGVEQQQVSSSKTKATVASDATKEYGRGANTATTTTTEEAAAAALSTTTTTTGDDGSMAAAASEQQQQTQSKNEKRWWNWRPW